jgi:uroporphyrinogen decarboxylase
MLGNIPPRDVLARGSTAEVASSVNDLLDSLQDRSRIVFSCGGGMSPGVPTENIQAFIQTLRKNQSP